MSVHEIRVKLGARSYPVFVGNGLLSRCAGRLRTILRGRKAVILSTPRIHRLHGHALARQVRVVASKVSVLLVADGEERKNEATLFRVLRGMARAGLQRDGCLLVLGGGVLGDIGGMAASLYMRGIDLVQCPTTLLAQTDAAIGGKTAVDFAGIKNLVGTFHQPKAVLADPLTLRTLSSRHFRTGLAEVIKHGIILDPRLFASVEKRLDRFLDLEPGVLEDLVARSVRIKAEVVARDERESGVRAFLNYGHTLGHAIESATGYRAYTHGQAVAIGMVFAARLSLRLGLCSPETSRRQEELLHRAGFPGVLPRVPSGELYRRMLLDKKARAGRIQFVLTRKIGVVTIISNVPKTTVFGVLNQLRSSHA
jgi:3-dehydroquinate synthase